MDDRPGSSNDGQRPGAMDPTALKPGRVVQLLNSTPLGTVVKPARFSQRRLEAGMRIAAKGDPDRINLLRYVAWRFDVVHAAADQAAGSADPYQRHLEQARARAERISASGRDIGPLPEVVNPERRKSAERSFRLFCERYMASTFVYPWSEDHLSAISKIERAVLQGGLFALAMPRGSGKSSLIEAAALWALLYGHRRFVACIAADESLAARALSSLQNQLEGHELLLEDFPEVCFPIQAMQRARQRAAGQTCMGKHTLVEWTKHGVVLPTIEGSVASGSIVAVASINGRIRGLKHTRADGTAIRPDLVLIDDPQTDESAASPKQCRDREATLIGAVLGLAGPGVKISGLMACTVIRQGDLADRMLDTAIHPGWQGERCKLVESFPTNTAVWERYAQLRKSSFASGMSPDEVADACNAFYAQNREAMEAGAAVRWEHRKYPSDASALQHAMNLRIDYGDEVFFAEFQNDPAVVAPGAEDGILHSDLASKLNRVKRGVVPRGTEFLTAFIDVQGKALFYIVCAWSSDMTGSVVEYGCEPEQPSRAFTLREITETLMKAAPGCGLEAAIRAGLDRLTERIMQRQWVVDGGGSMHISRCHVDAGWGETSELVYEFCAKSRFGGTLMPSKGVGITAGKAPISEWSKSPGDRIGLNWRVPAMVGRRHCRHVLFDANFWKSCVAARLKTSYGDPGAMYLCGASLEEHRLLADHLCAEKPTLVTANGRSASHWSLVAAGRDNHWFDCLVGSAVAANMLGATPPGLPQIGKRKRVSFADLAAKAKRNHARA